MDQRTAKKHPLPPTKQTTSQPLPVKQEEEFVRSIEDEKETEMDRRLVMGVLTFLVVLGVITGFFLSRGKTGISMAPGTSTTTTGNGKKVAGSNDTATFKDSAEGTLQKGGLDGEGTHNLVRPGGASQTVYLLSSVVDLDQFVGKKVKVWGQTIDAKKAPWLMDVGRVEEE